MIYGLPIQNLDIYKMTPYKKVSNFTKNCLAFFFILDIYFCPFLYF